MLDDVGSNLKTVKFFVQHFGCCMMLYVFGHIHATLIVAFWMLHDVIRVWPRSRNINCCTRACALGPLVAHQGPGAHKHRHVALKMLIAFGQPVQHTSQHHATMLQDVALKCCERLARPVCIHLPFPVSV